MPFKGSSARRGSITLHSQDPRFSMIDGAIKIQRNVLETQILDQTNSDDEEIIDDIKNYKPFDKEVYDRISRRCSLVEPSSSNGENLNSNSNPIDMKSLLAGMTNYNKKVENALSRNDSWSEKPDPTTLDLGNLGQSLGLDLGQSSDRPFDLLQSLDVIEAKLALDKCKLNICQSTKAPIDAEFKVESARRIEDLEDGKSKYEMVVKVECIRKGPSRFEICILEQRGRPQYKVVDCRAVWKEREKQ